MLDKYRILLYHKFNKLNKKEVIMNMQYKIRKFREEKGWTQEKLAAESNVSRTIISGLESGSISTTTTKTLLNIANALGKKVEEIFFED